MGDLLGFKAKFDITEAKARGAELKKMLADLKVDMSKVSKDSFDTKPMTEYQKELIRLKKEAQESAKANRDASLATQRALQNERLELIQINKQMAANRLAKQELADVKNKTIISDSQAEIDAYKKATQGSKELTSAVNKQNEAQAKAASEASGWVASAKQVEQAEKKSILTKEQIKKLHQEDKYIQQQRTKDLKNYTREILNAEGSIERYRARLIRLQTVYDRMSASERSSASGQRLSGTITNLNTQVLELEKSTGRAQRNVGNYLGTAWNGLKMIANVLPGLGIAGLLAFALDPLMDYIKGLDLFKKKLNQGQMAQEALKDSIAGSEYKKAQSEVNDLRINIDLAKKGMYDKKAVVDEYNKSIGSVAGQVKNLSQVEQGLIENADAYIQMTLYKAAANLQLEKAAQKAAEIQENSRKKAEEFANTFDKVVGNISAGGGGAGSLYGTGTFNQSQYERALREEGEKRKKVRQAELEKEKKDFVDNAKSLREVAAKAAKDMGGVLGLDAGTKVPSTARENALLNSRNAIQKQINELINNSVKVQMNADDAELESIRLKYEKIRQSAAEHYDKVNKLIKDPSKRAAYNLTTSKIDGAEDAEKSAAIYRQETERVKAQLVIQKGLYAEYEDYKSKLGKDAADERYGKLINVSMSYLEVLEAKEREFLSIGINNLSASQRDRLKIVQEGLKVEISAKQKQQDDLVKEFAGYAQKIKGAEEKLAADLATIGDNPEAKANRIKAFNDEVAALNKANMSKLESYEAMFKGVERLSVKSAERLIRKAKASFDQEVSEGKIKTQAEIDAINTLFDNLNKKLHNTTGKEIIELARQIDQVAEAVSGVNEEFGKILSTLSNVIGQVGNIKNSISDLKNAQGLGVNGMADFSQIGQLTAGIGIFSAGMSILTGLSKFFDKSAEREAQAQRNTELQIKQTEAANKALVRQLELIEDVYGTERLERYNKALADITTRRKDLNSQLNGKYQLTGDKTTDEYIVAINRGDKAADAFLKKNKAALEAFKIRYNNVEDLERLLDSGKLDDATTAIVRGLIEVEQQAKKTENALKMESVGTSLDSLADSFITGLTDQTQDFGKNFEEIIQRSILNGFKSKLIEKELQAYYDLFAKLSEDGLTEAEINILRDEKNRIVTQAKADIDALEKATGIDLNGSVSIEIDAKYQTLQDKIASALIAGGEEGAKAIDEILKETVLESFKAQVFTDGLKGFYEKLKQYQKSGPLNADQIADLKNEYFSFLEEANVKLTELEATTGLKFTIDLEAEKAKQQAEDLAEAIKAAVKTLEDGFISLFKSGTITAEDFAKNFEDIIKESILNGLQADIMTEGLKGFYAKLQDFQKSGGSLSKEEIDVLRAEYLAFVDEAKSKLAIIEEATGVSFSKIVETEVAAIDAGFQALQESITGIFSSSEKAGEDFVKNFDKLFNDSILNTFKNTFLADQLKDFYADFAAMTKDGAIPAKAQIEEMRVRYEAIIAASDAKLRELEALTGQKLIPDQTTEVIVDVVIDDSELKSLQQSIFALFESGTLAAEDFGNNFDEIVKRSILGALQQQIFTDGLRAFYDKLKAFQESGGGLTQEEIATLKTEYFAFIDDAQAKLKAIEQATGLSFTKVIEEIPPVVIEVDDSELKSLQQSIFALFDSTSMKAEDFGDNFKEIIRRSILDGFQAQVFADGLRTFYDKLKSFQQSGGNLSAAEIAELQSEYDAFIKDAQAKFYELEKITGVSLAKPLQEAVETAVESVDSEFEALQDSILAIFAGGKDAAEDFGKSFEEIMRKSILNAFKEQYLAGQLKTFYDQLNSYTQYGQVMSEAQIQALRVQYDTIIANGKERLKEFEQISGISVSDQGASSRSLAGQISEKITETTANELEGVLRATYEKTKMISVYSLAAEKGIGRIVDLQVQSLQEFRNISKYTKETAENTRVLKGMADDIRKMSGGSSRPAQDLFDMGLGKTG
jgi:hypothetical protein